MIRKRLFTWNAMHSGHDSTKRRPHATFRKPFRKGGAAMMFIGQSNAGGLKNNQKRLRAFHFYAMYVDDI